MYRQLTDIRHQHSFSLTALASTHQVFSFARHGETADMVVVMNVMEEVTSVSLASLLLEIGLTSSEGTVLVRSSGLGSEGNTVGATVDLGNLTLTRNEALVIQVKS